jgi:hypothetical protein
LIPVAGKKKKAPAPPPPSAAKSLLSLKEEDSITDHLPSAHVPNETKQKSQTLPAIVKSCEGVAASSASESCRRPSASLAVDETGSRSNLSSDEVDSAIVPHTSAGNSPSLSSARIVRERKHDCTIRRRHKRQSIAVDVPRAVATAPSRLSVYEQGRRHSEPFGRDATPAKKNSIFKVYDEIIRYRAQNEPPDPILRTRKHNGGSGGFTVPSVKVNNLEVGDVDASDDCRQRVAKDDASSEDNEHVVDVERQEHKPEEKIRNEAAFERPSLTKKPEPPPSYRAAGYFNDGGYFVQRRRSEIEARIHLNRMEANNTDLKWRKASEGSLTFSKIPSTFLFPAEPRYVVFDSRRNSMEREGARVSAVHPEIANFNIRPAIPKENFRNGDAKVTENNNFLEELNNMLSRKLGNCV